VNEEIGEKIGDKMRAKGLDVPLGSRRWMPFQERVIFEFKSSNPRGCFGCVDGSGDCVFLSEREGRGDATGDVLAKEKAEIFIALVPRAEWESKELFAWRTKISLNAGNHD